MIDVPLEIIEAVKNKRIQEIQQAQQELIDHKQFLLELIGCVNAGKIYKDKTIAGSSFIA